MYKRSFFFLNIIHIGKRTIIIIYIGTVTFTIIHERTYSFNLYRVQGNTTVTIKYLGHIQSP